VLFCGPTLMQKVELAQETDTRPACAGYVIGGAIKVQSDVATVLAAGVPDPAETPDSPATPSIPPSQAAAIQVTNRRFRPVCPRAKTPRRSVPPMVSSIEESSGECMGQKAQSGLWSTTTHPGAITKCDSHYRSPEGRRCSASPTREPPPTMCFAHECPISQGRGVVASSKQLA